MTQSFCIKKFAAEQLLSNKNNLPAKYAKYAKKERKIKAYFISFFRVFSRVSRAIISPRLFIEIQK